jgi:GNAT superfamily N-acetyltransferase
MVSRIEDVPKIVVKELKPSMWPDVVRLFGPGGAVGGCWCMYWRHPLGERWEDNKGRVNRRRFAQLVKSGKAHGALAYIGDEPVGWVSFDRRSDFPKLDRAPSFRCDDPDRVWSVPCFFIKSRFRGRGVASALLRFAVRAMKKRGAAVIEGYPARPPEGKERLVNTYAWTGTLPMFTRAGFHLVGPRDMGKQRMRLAPAKP